MPQTNPRTDKAAAAGADLASVFFALGDRTRLQLVAVLCAGGAFSIAQLTANTDLTRQAVTRHLQVLADAGLVRDLKVGRERLWQFDPAQMEEARKSLEVIGRQWEQALGSLKASLEG
ncbi:MULTISPECIES: ArsR/SmtB family transcription factor [Polaromonas]|uniref:ArsR/SmtB family transcription factor n=1 Tax=Polaromonas aquatica TaxID=332657 RepID=A0ABW1U2P2_9BURK